MPGTSSGYGDEIVAAHLPEHRKIRCIRNDARVALSLETQQRNPMGLTEYLVIYGTARVTEGGAAGMLQRLAHTYLGPDVKFPPADSRRPATSRTSPWTASPAWGPGHPEPVWPAFCRDRRSRKTVRRFCGALTQWRIMANFELVTAADVQLMQDLAQRVTATRLDLVNSDATFGELAWIWGKGHASDGASWPRQLWFSGADLVAWSWAYLPHQVRRSDGSVRDVAGAYLTYQVHPGHAGLVDEVIDWYDGTAASIERTVLPSAADEFALKRWAAHGYQTDPAALGDAGSWTQLNERDLTDVEQPVLPAGFRFRTADEAGPKAAVQAHLDAWAPSTYTAEGYQGVRQTTAYRGDLHILVEAPDGTMASSTIMWLDEANKTAEFEPVGTHPDYRRLGLGRAMLLHGMQLARAAGATHMTVACLGAPGHPQGRGLFYSVGFRELMRDAPLIKTKAAG